MIETERLLLRSMLQEDFEGLYRVFSDARVLASFGLETFSREQMRRWLQRNLDHQQEHGFGLFSVILKADGTLIGDCGLEMMDVDGERVAELGYDFLNDYWNRGYATEAARSVRDFAFFKQRLPKLISLIRVGNEASRRVAEKVGMRLEREENRGEIRYWIYSMNRNDSPPSPTS